ncbi:MAG: ABC transporter permease [Verrucomicrobiaceae bacterium]|nr:ABC transporter permease [Verrucomicrobiaceae bacterium]
MPSLAWMTAFFAIPAVLTLSMAFRPSDLRGGIGEGWSLETLRAVLTAEYLPVVWRTVWMSAVTMVICVLAALPVAFHMARVCETWRRVLLLLVVVPFLTNFIIRIFAWKSLLHPEGALTQFLMRCGLVSEDAMLLNNAGAVLLVLIYTQLPFAILPLYAAAEKFEFPLLDAARDLGAGPWQAFWGVFVPGVRRGIVSACILVFVSALGQYVIPQFVGGPSDEMLGNKITQRAFGDRNLPHASALAACLLLAVVVPMVMTALWRKWRVVR